MIDEKAQELAEQIDVNHFDKRLQDGVQRFITMIESSKRDLSKNELVSLAKGLVRYPDLEGAKFSPKIHDLLEVGCDAKDNFVALTVQILIEEGQRKSEPQFKPKGE